MGRMRRLLGSRTVVVRMDPRLADKLTTWAKEFGVGKRNELITSLLAERVRAKEYAEGKELVV